MNEQGSPFDFGLAGGHLAAIAVRLDHIAANMQNILIDQDGQRGSKGGIPSTTHGPEFLEACADAGRMIHRAVREGFGGQHLLRTLDEALQKWGSQSSAHTMEPVMREALGCYNLLATAGNWAAEQDQSLSSLTRIPEAQFDLRREMAANARAFAAVARFFSNKLALHAKQTITDGPEFLSAAALAQEFDLPKESTRKCLDTWRKHAKDSDYRVIENPRLHEPKYLYSRAAAGPILARLKSQQDRAAVRRKKSSVGPVDDKN